LLVFAVKVHHDQRRGIDTGAKMNERIHQHLDGELPLEDLSPEERAELTSYSAFLRHVEELGRSEAVPDMTRSIMARIEAQDAAAPATGEAPTLLGSLERGIRWFWEPRPIRMRPAWGVVAAAALLVLTLVVPGETPAPVTVAEQAEAPAPVFVQFRLDAPGASNVHLAGSFTDWEPHYSLHEVAPGVWALLVPLTPGVHDYSFVVDGREWRADPVAPRIDDGFGGQNSRVAVLSPQYNSL
jgi:hypothetical protein